MKLVHQLPLALGVTLLVASAAGLFGVYQMNAAANIYARLIEVNGMQARQVADAQIDYKNEVQNGKDILIRGGNPEQYAKYWGGFQKYEQATQTATDKLAAELPPGEARSKIERFNVLHRHLGEAFRQALEQFKASGFDIAVGDKATDGLDREAVITLRVAGEKIVEETIAADARAKARQKRAALISFAAMAATLLAGMAGAVLFSRAITRKLGGEPDDARDAAREIATGNLAVDVRLTPGDTDSLMAAMKSMTESLCAIVGQVRHSSDAIASGSSQIASGSADLSQRTEEQASALQQTAASMEELSATVKQNAQNATQASRLATAARAVAMKGGKGVEEVVETMKGIRDSARKIADIIGIIDDLSAQTNILALNAAVEAARAGEQGRGFAVVASAVRSLAQRSAQAANEIKALISESVERVNDGAALVDGAGATMTEVVGAISRLAVIVGEISSASAEQSVGVEQVGKAVGQMDQTTQRNAALVEESAAAAESLKSQAAQLVACVARFRF
ncbi:methyl-accepting chemotaxis protein [Trinickia sp.]|uniref:methyl-accepting chemotaxis protein n=1 Tax=Trinickia sp. TaxID=2571163 RepID=UPI003F7FCC9E